MHRKVLMHLLTLQDTVKTYHWLTHEYGHHKATDEFYQALNELVDRYVEVFLSKFGAPTYKTFKHCIFESI